MGPEDLAEIIDSAMGARDRRQARVPHYSYTFAWKFEPWTSGDAAEATRRAEAIQVRNQILTEAQFDQICRDLSVVGISLVRVSRYEVGDAYPVAPRRWAAPVVLPTGPPPGGPPMKECPMCNGHRLIPQVVKPWHPGDVPDGPAAEVRPSPTETVSCPVCAGSGQVIDAVPTDDLGHSTKLSVRHPAPCGCLMCQRIEQNKNRIAASRRDARA